MGEVGGHTRALSGISGPPRERLRGAAAIVTGAKCRRTLMNVPIADVCWRAML